MTIVIAPDKFKGSLTSFEFCDTATAAIQAVCPDAVVQALPLADGGDGFSEVIRHYYHTVNVDCDTTDPVGNVCRAVYQWQADTATAYIETAAASGLVLIKPDNETAKYASTYGTGLMIQHAIEKGARHIVLGLGGSATTDAGTGILTALGFQFINAAGETLRPCGGNLQQVQRIVVPEVLPDVDFTLACDVTNTLYGPRGAAFVFAPQKGANADTVELLDIGLQHIAILYNKATGKDITFIEGTGAAGGIAAGLMSFFTASISKGTDLVLEAAAFYNNLEKVSLIITGEGSIDAQTPDGKPVGVIARAGLQHNIPVIAFCGVCNDPVLLSKQMGLEQIVVITPAGTPLQEAIMQARENLYKAMTAVMEKRKA
ncbi:MAG: glycerate kinase [Chitinophagaceae bacterium]